MFTKIVVSCLVVFILSTFSQAIVGDGTVDNPFQISTGSDLLAVNEDLSASYVIINDIDLLEYLTENPNLKIGTSSSAPFSGKFNGRGHTISNYSFDKVEDCGALFGHTSSTAVIEGVKIIDVDISTGTGRYAAALVGNNYGTIDMCESSGTVSGGNFCAGLAARNYGTITRSRSNVSVTSQSRGGIITAYNGSGAFISQSCAQGSVTSYDRVGGLVGENVGSIANCYSSVTVTGTEKTGGFAGTSATGAITNCYSTGFVTGSLYTGAFIGDRVSGSVLGCFFDNQTCGIALAVGRGASIGIIGETTDLMKTESTFTDAGWDFLGLYFMPPDSYPRLYWELAGNGDINGDGIVNEFDLYIMISQWLSSALESERLSADLDFSGTVDYKDFAVLAEFWLIDDGVGDVIVTGTGGVVPVGK